MKTEKTIMEQSDNEYITEIVKPIGDIIITTSERYSPNKLMLGTAIPLKDTKLAGTLKEFQTVVSVGPYAINQGINIGDRIMINLSNYADTKFKKETLKTASENENNVVVNYYVPVIMVNKQEHLRLGVRDVIAVIKTDAFN